MNLATANKYPIVKANRKFSVYRKSSILGNGLCRLVLPVGSYSAGATVGVIVKVLEMPKGDHVAYIQLSEPVSSGLFTITHGLQFLSNLDEVPAVVPFDATNVRLYWCTGNSVNIRKSASTTAGKFTVKLDKGDIIGTSDGVLKNGFLKFNLKQGGTGYVSKTYCTLQEPAKAVTKVIQITNEVTKEVQKVEVPVIPEATQKFDLQKTAIGAVIAFGVTFALSKIVNNFSKK